MRPKGASESVRKPGLRTVNVVGAPSVFKKDV